MNDSLAKEQKNVLSEAFDLKMALTDVLGMISEQSTVSNGNTETVAPQSSLKLDNLRNTILDCREITNAIGKGLRLLV